MGIFISIIQIIILGYIVNLIVKTSKVDKKEISKISKVLIISFLILLIATVLLSFLYRYEVQDLQKKINSELSFECNNYLFMKSQCEEYKELHRKYNLNTNIEE